MKLRTPIYVIGSLLLIIAVLSAAAWSQAVVAQETLKRLWLWPEAMDSVNAAPKNHRVLFEDTHVRLLEVTVQPGETENMHGHKYPSIFMMDAPQPHTINKNLEEGVAPPDAGRDGNKPPRPRSDGPVGFPSCRAMTSPQAPHQITNVDSFPQHFYRMEFKKIDGEAIREMKSYPANEGLH